MECPNYKLLDTIINTQWNAKFGYPDVYKFLIQNLDRSVYDTVIELISDHSTTIDCQLAKMIFRVAIELRNKDETFEEYYEWRSVDNILQSTWPTFLDDNHPETFDYIEIDGLPGITLDDIPPLEPEAYLETYWYSPKVTAHMMIHDINTEMPGIHCIKYSGGWIYFSKQGLVKANDVNVIISEIENYCVHTLHQEPGLIVMNPEDTRIAFNV